MGYTKLPWGELLKRLRSPIDTPDYGKASDEIRRRLTVLGAVIASLLLLVAILSLIEVLATHN